MTNMKKIKKYSKKPLAITILVVCVVLIAAAAWWYLGRPKYSTIGDASQKDSTVKSTSVPDNTGSSSTANTTTGSQSSSNGSSVVVSPIDSPGTSDPYPIVNEHYKIDQINATTYTITLYAISNSPSQYDEYTAQLKQFKQEALSYLTTRYGDISKFSLTWSPPSAGSL